jgi:hypothetical protein
MWRPCTQLAWRGSRQSIQPQRRRLSPPQGHDLRGYRKLSRRRVQSQAKAKASNCGRSDGCDANVAGDSGGGHVGDANLCEDGVVNFSFEGDWSRSIW